MDALMLTSFLNTKIGRMGRFRYWLLDDFIQKGQSDHAGHRIFAAREFRDAQAMLEYRRNS